MTDLDPQTVRKIAREHIRSGHTSIGITIVKHFGDTVLGDEEFAAWEYAVHEAWQVALRDVTWPDEQPQDEPEPPRLFTDIDRDTTPFLRVRAFIDAARQKPDTGGMGIASVLDRDGVMHRLTEDDVESLLEDVGDMQEEIDRLIGELVKARQPQAERDARASGDASC